MCRDLYRENFTIRLWEGGRPRPSKDLPNLNQKCHKMIPNCGYRKYAIGMDEYLWLASCRVLLLASSNLNQTTTPPSSSTTTIMSRSGWETTTFWTGRRSSRRGAFTSPPTHSHSSHTSSSSWHCLSPTGSSLKNWESLTDWSSSGSAKWLVGASKSVF